MCGWGIVSENERIKKHNNILKTHQHSNFTLFDSKKKITGYVTEKDYCEFGN